MLKRFLKIITLFSVSVVSFTALALWFFFGSGKPYPDLTTPPYLDKTELEPAVVSSRPIGNATVSHDGRIFYTIHPESNPDYPKLYEWIDGQAIAYPEVEKQKQLFNSPLGVVVDRQNVLWIIDPGNHGIEQPALIGFDLNSNEISHIFRFPKEIAPLGSFLQDLQVSADGNWIYIADVGFWPKRPALIVYNRSEGKARRLLNRHSSVYPQNYLIRTQIRDMSYLGGLLEMKTGIDGIALSHDGNWLYYAAMNHDTLYRISTSKLQNFQLSEVEIENHIEVVGTKPLNDGLSIDSENNVLITDIEHQSVVRMKPDGSVETLLKSDKIRWADSLSYGPDGWLYLADSAIPHLILQNHEYIAEQAPFYIWRFKPGMAGVPGQ